MDDVRGDLASFRIVLFMAVRRYPQADSHHATLNRFIGHSFRRDSRHRSTPRALRARRVIHDVVSISNRCCANGCADALLLTHIGRGASPSALECSSGSDRKAPW